MGYNWLWIGAAILPFGFGLLVNKSRQDSDAIQNAYRYLLAKRAASCEFESNARTVNKCENLSKLLGNSGETLYELEQKMVDQIAQGKF